MGNSKRSVDETWTQEMTPYKYRRLNSEYRELQYCRVEDKRVFSEAMKSLTSTIEEWEMQYLQNAFQDNERAQKVVYKVTGDMCLAAKRMWSLYSEKLEPIRVVAALPAELDYEECVAQGGKYLIRWNDERVPDSWEPKSDWEEHQIVYDFWTHTGRVSY
jgi:hypothetical protein